MLKFFKYLTKSKNENSPRFRYDMAKKLNGRHIKYVTERENNEDIVIGHDGCLAIHDDDFIVLSDGDTKFRAKITDLSFSELMSLDGVILSGNDIEHGDVYRTVIVYYKYYR